MTVIGLYFVIKGFTKTIYKAYEQALIKTNKFPKTELVPPAFCPYAIKSTAPIPPSAMPTSLIVVIFSFKIKALKIKTITGTAVIIIDASMGEVKLNPLKKNIWLEATPSNPQRISNGKSFFATFSLINDLMIQNNNPAPKILKKTNAEGPILLGIIPLATIWFTP